MSSEEQAHLLAELRCARRGLRFSGTDTGPIEEKGNDFDMTITDK